MLVRPRSLASFSKSMPFSRARARTDGGAMMSLMSAPLPAGRDVLGFHELKHAFMPAFTTQARLLHATEGGGGVADQPAVQADHAVFEPFADLKRAFEVFGENIGDKTVFGVIGAAYDLFLVLEGLDCCNRAEDLVADAFGILGDVREDSRRIVKALALGRGTAAFDFRTLCHGVGYEFSDLVARRSVYQRANINTWVRSITNLEGRHACAQAFGELIRDTFMHIDA